MSYFNSLLSMVGLLVLFIPAPVMGHDYEYTADTPGVATFLVPDFYGYKVRKIQDTEFVTKCYDMDDSLLEYWESFEDVRYISIFRNYNDPIHTYRDNGIDKPLPITQIIERYDKVGDNKWLHVGYVSHKYEYLKEYPNDILKTDTVKEGEKVLIYRFFRTGL